MGKILLIVVLAAAVIWWLKRGQRPGMSEGEARAVLGVSADADADAIRAAHRRLVTAVHPDRGGSADLTQRLNAARDVLLKRLG
ncbi:DnaJ domain-containing protein [Sphingomonas aestuarii]|jgi:DnaJ homolog subfamily C member 19